MRVALSERDLLAKIGELVLVNEALTGRVHELEAEVAALRASAQPQDEVT